VSGPQYVITHRSFLELHYGRIAEVLGFSSADSQAPHPERGDDRSRITPCSSMASSSKGARSRLLSRPWIWARHWRSLVARGVNILFTTSRGRTHAGERSLSGGAQSWPRPALSGCRRPLIYDVGSSRAVRIFHRGRGVRRAYSIAAHTEARERQGGIGFLNSWGATAVLHYRRLRVVVGQDGLTLSRTQAVLRRLSRPLKPDLS